MHILEDVIYFSLDIVDGIDIAYDRDLKSFLAAMCNDGKHETMVRV